MFPRDVPGALSVRKILVMACAVIGLSGCAAPESVRQAAIQNCLQVGISQSDPQFPVCARSYALQQQDGALNRTYRIEDDAREHDRDRDHRFRNRGDVFR